MINHNGLPLKIMSFLMRNRDEEVSIQDMAVKFDATYLNTQKALNRLVRAECLMARSIGNSTLYSYPEID